jgi:hypothetical protein
MRKFVYKEMANNFAEQYEGEESIPASAAGAFKSAADSALKAGLSILVSDDSFLVRVYPDGRRERVKKIKSPVDASKAFEPGVKKSIKWS